MESPKWLELAKADLGQHEVAGSGSNPKIMRYWTACDYDPHPDDGVDAWCSAAVNWWMQEAGEPGTRAPNARSWLKWGAEIKEPKPGCVVVFWRGSPTGWQGHVALYIGPGDSVGKIKVLGGNQRDGVRIDEYPKAQVLGYRWPKNGGNSRTIKAQVAGTAGDVMVAAAVSSKAIIESAPDALAIGSSIQSLAAYWPWFAVIGITIGILARMTTIWARLSTWREKGV